VISARGIGFVCAALLVAGCADDPEPVASHTVRDSAGIRIIENVSASWNAGEQWTRW